MESYAKGLTILLESRQIEENNGRKGRDINKNEAGVATHTDGQEE